MHIDSQPINRRFSAFDTAPTDLLLCAWQLERSCACLVNGPTVSQQPALCRIGKACEPVIALSVRGHDQVVLERVFRRTLRGQILVTSLRPEFPLLRSVRRHGIGNLDCQNRLSLVFQAISRIKRVAFKSSKIRMRTTTKECCDKTTNSK